MINLIFKAKRFEELTEKKKQRNINQNKAARNSQM